MIYKSGFTLIEIVVVISILSFLSAVVVFNFIFLKKGSDLNNNTQEFTAVLKLAQNKTLSSENYDQYGVFVNTSVQPNQYVLFKGPSYALREVSADQIYFLQDSMEFFDVDFAGGSEIVFERLTGATEDFGSISIKNITDESQFKTIYAGSSGIVGFNPPADLLDDYRIKDSRHIQFNYNRIIDAANESIMLTFNGSSTIVVPISSYLEGGELQWQDTVNIEGADQTVKIGTVGLNTPNVLFSIRRDRRYNDKSLNIAISGDNSGYLADYSADGLNTDFSSVNVYNFEWR